MNANNREEAQIRTTLFHTELSNMVYEIKNGSYIARPENEEETAKRIRRKIEEENAFNSYRFNPETVNYSLN